MALQRMYTINETCNLLRKTRRTVYNYVKDGRLKAVKLQGDREWRINEKDLKAFMEGK